MVLPFQRALRRLRQWVRRSRRGAAQGCRVDGWPVTAWFGPGDVEWLRVEAWDRDEGERLARGYFGHEQLAARRSDDGQAFTYVLERDGAAHLAPDRPAWVRWHDYRVLARGLGAPTQQIECAGIRLIPVDD